MPSDKTTVQTTNTRKESLLTFPELNLLFNNLLMLFVYMDPLIFGLLPAGTIWTDHFFIK